MNYETIKNYHDTCINLLIGAGFGEVLSNGMRVITKEPDQYDEDHYGLYMDWLVYGSVGRYMLINGIHYIDNPYDVEL